MTSDEIKAARIHAVTASKLCEMYGMVAGNTYREHQGCAPMYNDEDFFTVAAQLENRIQAILKETE